MKDEEMATVMRQQNKRSDQFQIWRQSARLDWYISHGLDWYVSPFQINVIHAHREILSKLPTLLRHKLQSKIAHFAALDSVYVYKTIRNQYHTSYSLHFMHLNICYEGFCCY